MAWLSPFPPLRALPIIFFFLPPFLPPSLHPSFRPSEHDPSIIRTIQRQIQPHGPATQTPPSLTIISITTSFSLSTGRLKPCFHLLRFFDLAATPPQELPSLLSPPLALRSLHAPNTTSRAHTPHTHTRFLLALLFLTSPRRLPLLVAYRMRCRSTTPANHHLFARPTAPLRRRLARLCFNSPRES